VGNLKLKLKERHAVIPRAGDFFVTQIAGPGHKFVVLGQAIIGDASRFTHAGIVINDEEIIEAMPGGAIKRNRHVYTTIKAAQVTRYSRWNITYDQRDKIVEEALKLIGTKYSWLDYISLALEHTSFFQPKYLKKYIANTGHMICSQLVDEVYKRAGLQMFNDDRSPGDVTPGDLTYILNGPESEEDNE